MTNPTTKLYQEVKKTQPRTLRQFARHIALDGLSLKTKLPGSNKILGKPRIQFLYIHHVFDDELDKFDKLLNVLSINHTFISYSEAVHKIHTNSIDKPYISISSDDGFKNNMAAASILERYGISGCFFINPDTVGLNKYSEIERFCSERLDFPPTDFLDWNDVNTLLKNGHEIGSHTMSHIQVSETNLARVAENLSMSYKMIHEKCGSVSHFAFPYGRFHHFNQASLDLVYKAGYISCASAERGCHVAQLEDVRLNELILRRDHIICDWSINHIMYFILTSSQNSSPQTNANPYK